MAIKDQTTLIRDLLDPDLDTAEVARRHHAGPEDLRAAVRSPAFCAAAAAMREVDEARTAALLPAQQARAVQRLARIAAQPAETTAQAESARRAATALIRCRPAPGPEREASSLPTSPLSSPEQEPPTRPRDPALTRAVLAALAAADPAPPPTEREVSSLPPPDAPDPLPREPLRPKQSGASRTRPATPTELFARLRPG